MATQTETLPSAVGSLSLSGSLNPLKSTGALDQYKPVELTPVIGTQFRGVQLVDLLDAPNADDLLKELAITIHRRNVVFFKEQQAQLTNDQLKRLATKLGQLTASAAGTEWGGLHIHPTEKHRDDNEISPITAKAFITFEPVPSDIAILNVWEIPENGGDTLWAYDRLTPALAKFLEGLTALHDGNHFHKVAELQQKPLYDGVRGHSLNKGANLQAVHPLITVNPVTGWKGLFVNQVFTKRIVELSEDESDHLLKYLFTLVKENHDLQVRFKWDKDDVALWSNTSSYHNVTLDYTGYNRTGHRAVSLGSKPFFTGEGKSRREDLGLGAWIE
ncbi:Alpha-ketoglutarate-dependent taurine dioxygenase [Rhodotorula toruloides]|nr:Alpha-ketoglutarate-dependent taurine dioxygenase [Rhodotorula toruloides]